MARATNAVARKRRKKKVLKEAKGYFGRKHSSYRLANEQVMRSGAYAYRDRRTRKRGHGHGDGNAVQLQRRAVEQLDRNHLERAAGWRNRRQ